MAKKKVSRDTSNPEQVRTEEEMFALRQQVELGMLQDVLATFEGRRVIYNILAKAGIYDDAPEDPVQSDRFLGMRRLGLIVLDEVLTARSDVYILMQKEGRAFEEKYQFVNIEGEEDNG